MAKISTKIALVINREIRDIELAKKVSDLQPLVRIFCRVQFRELEESNIGLVDTGAHISLIPFYIWKKFSHTC